MADMNNPLDGDDSFNKDDSSTKKDDQNTPAGNDDDNPLNNEDKETSTNGENGEGDGGEDDEDNVGNTEYFSADELGTVQALREYQSENPSKGATLADLEGDEAGLKNSVNHAVDRTTENFKLCKHDLNRIKASFESGHIVNEKTTQLSIKAIARKMGCVVDFECYRGRTIELIDNLIKRL